jgi:hypothetical protein
MLHLASYDQPLGLRLNVNLKTKDKKTYKCRRVIDFYLANILEESILRVFVYLDAVVGEYF